MSILFNPPPTYAEVIFEQAGKNVFSPIWLKWFNDLAAAQVIKSGTAGFTDYTGAAAGTLTNAPAAGNPTKWIAFNDAGVIRRIPTW